MIATHITTRCKQCFTAISCWLLKRTKRKTLINLVLIMRNGKQKLGVGGEGRGGGWGGAGGGGEADSEREADRQGIG